MARLKFFVDDDGIFDGGCSENSCASASSCLRPSLQWPIERTTRKMNERLHHDPCIRLYEMMGAIVPRSWKGRSTHLKKYV